MALNTENEWQRCAQPGYEVGTAPYRVAKRNNRPVLR
ncbi:hypothetical protein FEP28_05432 [Burkholderia multivorans]|nr:hypothetical protein [Burkholderia multivorans]MDR9059884.1 hypothetical protein [Burkholderia multivorans]MDR9083570.1 hypothetical protein [Burkholderia multivorans]MDR9095433.1 hypothetical protein [Burkholderia multivorans]MDR9101885.1 hypothetical protein [Burkholderia multivorans]